ncbi:MAG: hypothetical protein GF329_01275 [Candidatus Lokiarchaeota archaeon]|nr:hypothetical protein [Candidatus Lokiarchaeota archaeon]
MSNSKLEQIINDLGINYKKSNIILRSATFEDASSIIDLYTEAYNDTYPYPPWNNRDYVKAAIKDSKIRWMVFEDTNGTLAGTNFVEINNETETAINHGAIIKKEFRGYGLGRRTILDSYLEIMKKEEVDLGWCEARTAHKKSQKMLIKGGYIPVGFLPHKDNFLGKKESDLIFVWYNYKKNVFEKRRKDVKIISEILPLYNYVSDFLNEPLNKPKIENWEKHDMSIHTNISISIENKGNNYIEMVLEVDENNFISFKINQEINMAEGFKISVQKGNKKAFDSLLYVINEIFHDKLDYIEIWISAYEPERQKSCIMLGFIPTGYIPAIEINNEEKREDKIVFIKSRSYPKTCNQEIDNLKLIDRIKILFELFKYNQKTIENQNWSNKNDESRKC